jgi:hypothetical protein
MTCSIYFHNFHAGKGSRAAAAGRVGIAGAIELVAFTIPSVPRMALLLQALCQEACSEIGQRREGSVVRPEGSRHCAHTDPQAWKNAGWR